MAEHFRHFGGILCILLSFSIVILTTSRNTTTSQYSSVVRITIEKLSKIHKMLPKRRNFSVINFQKFHKLFFSHNEPKSSKIQHFDSHHQIQLSLNPLTKGLDLVKAEEPRARGGGGGRGSWGTGARQGLSSFR